MCQDVRRLFDLLSQFHVQLIFPDVLRPEKASGGRQLTLSITGRVLDTGFIGLHGLYNASV